ncbi:MAG TPA: hypothetical protein VE956_01750 [Nodularia sp. (in: cyanobacteria)]|nr:hypothetical protein [Nodularia sp. (in: cyanobacteria)]
MVRYFYRYDTPAISTYKGAKHYMLTIKRKYLTWTMLLLVGTGYFSAMSSLDIHYFEKSLIVIMPIQVGSVIYITYLRWSRSKSQPKAINS